MKFYNMRTNEVITDYSDELFQFLKEHTLEEGDSDEDFFVNHSQISSLSKKASSTEEKEFVDALKAALKGEVGRSGIDIYYE
ncbi:MAG: hypothetical protein OEZ36_00615 [Spirochaetota bacterium]|nr:hypothetical protein [Spirochaetota bacterium]